MKLRSITLASVKSFGKAETIHFHSDYTVLIGPNAGGKSNLLDIVTIILRQFLMPRYNRVPVGGNRRGYNIVSEKAFTDIEQALDRFEGGGPPVVTMRLEVTKEDLGNMRVMQDCRQQFEEERSKYNSAPSLSFAKEAQLNELKEGTVLEYTFQHGGVSGTMENNSPEETYWKYLQHFEYFVLLSETVPQARLRPIALFFSPYRSVQETDFRVTLSEDQYSTMYYKYLQTTSKTDAPVMKMGAHYFAEKRRVMEEGATTEGYTAKFRNDDEVSRVTQRLARLGYSWDLNLEDPAKNTYAVVLRDKGGRELPMSRASSGEKEIMNFLFGIFAVGISNGCVMIDEPELHLHPTWQGVLLDLFLDLQQSTKSQFIIATHSPTFVTPRTIANVVRIFKSGEASKTVAIKRNELPKARTLLRIVNSHNNEKLFFADKVVLVEGITDRLVISKVLDVRNKTSEHREAIEVLAVHGKCEFEKYTSLLGQIGVQHFVIADLDHAPDVGTDEIKALFVTDEKKICKALLKDKKSKDRLTLCAALEAAINTSDTKRLKDIWDYIKGRLCKLKGPLDEDDERTLKSFIDSQREKDVFILRYGEIEDYLPESWRQPDRIVALVSRDDFWDLLGEDRDRRAELGEIADRILHFRRETSPSDCDDRAQAEHEGEALG